MQFWLKTMVDVYAQLSDGLPDTALESVELRLPVDLIEFLVSEKVVYKTDGKVWFHYSKTLNVPVLQI